MDSNCCSEPVSYAAVEGDCAGGLVIEVFDYSDKVGSDVVLLRGLIAVFVQDPPGGADQKKKSTKSTPAKER